MLGAHSYGKLFKMSPSCHRVSNLNTQKNIRNIELICSKGIKAFYQAHNQNTRKTPFQASLELTRGCLIWTKWYFFSSYLIFTIKHQIFDFSTPMITVNTGWSLEKDIKAFQKILSEWMALKLGQSSPSSCSIPLGKYFSQIFFNFVEKFLWFLSCRIIGTEGVQRRPMITIPIPSIHPSDIGSEWTKQAWDWSES